MAMLFLMQQGAVGCLFCKGDLLFIFHLPTSTSTYFFARLLWSQLTHGVYWCMRLFLPKVQDCAVHFVVFLDISVGAVLQPAEVPLCDSTPMGPITHSPSFVWSENMVRVHSVSFSRSLMKKLNSPGPSTSSWSTLLLTGTPLHPAGLHVDQQMINLWAEYFNQFSIRLMTTTCQIVRKPNGKDVLQWNKITRGPSFANHFKVSLLFYLISWFTSVLKS